MPDAESPEPEAASRAVAVRPATEADIPFLMATERLPGYEEVVGRSSVEGHRDWLADPDAAVTVGSRLPGGPPLGFAVVLGLEDRYGQALLKRIAVAAAGGGFGRPFLRAVLDRTFGLEQVHRVWLDVVAPNARARHVYASVGFVEEGVWRESYVLSDGRRTDRILMAILRREWEAR